MEALILSFATEDPNDRGIENQTLTDVSDTLEMKLEEANEKESSLVIILGKPLGRQFFLGCNKMKF